jgi:hypothetical protein
LRRSHRCLENAELWSANIVEPAFHTAFFSKRYL